jgi:DNA (cytosine-5)-methyltransferase 1
MRAVSLFSGAGGLDLGLERAGIETVLQCELDPWARSVLQRHWPEVPKVDDVRDIRDDGRGMVAGIRWPQPARPAGRHGLGVDLVAGGFPCQDVSVAGKRAGFGGERSSLWFEFHRVLRELRPTWALIENVPGLLSSHRGRDFAVLLGGLEDLGYGWAYGVLDARWFGVPQRRRRVFIVGCLGGAAAAGAVLAVCEGCGGHPAPRREAGEGVAATLSGGSHSPGVNLPGRRKEDDENLVVGSLRSHPRPGSNDVGTLTVARSLNASPFGYRMDWESETLVAGAQRASDGHHGHSSPRAAGAQAPGVAGRMGVRRLVPRECERLMGWPDDFTRWTADGKEIPDSHRYRLCGNGVVAPVGEWIGHRLVAVDALLRAELAGAA